MTKRNHHVRGRKPGSHHAKTRRRAFARPQYEDCPDCKMGLPCPHVSRDLELKDPKYGRRGNARHRYGRDAKK